MTADLRAILSWKTWRFISTEDVDSIPASSKQTDASGNIVFSGGSINVYPYSAIAVRMFGTNTNNDTAFVDIGGSMDDQRKTGTGPYQLLWNGQVILGSRQATITTTGRPLHDGKWPAATYLEVDTYDTIDGNPANSVVLGGSAENVGSAMLILPTLGYSVLTMRITGMGGGGTEMSTLGALYREIAMGGVV